MDTLDFIGLFQLPPMGSILTSMAERLLTTDLYFTTMGPFA